MRFRSNEELRNAVVDGVLDCKYEDLICDFSIDVEAHIINAHDIKAQNINARDIKAWDITALDINAQNITALDIKAQNITALDIKAWDITALDIKALDINAHDIKALDIKARDISYHAVCLAYKNIRCKSIIGGRLNSKHFVLDGKITVEQVSE